MHTEADPFGFDPSVSGTILLNAMAVLGVAKGAMAPGPSLLIAENGPRT